MARFVAPAQDNDGGTLFDGDPPEDSDGGLARDGDDGSAQPALDGADGGDTGGSPDEADPGADGDEDCPQRKLGCEAMMVNMIANFAHDHPVFQSFSDLARKLEESGCTVRKFDAREWLRPMPKRMEICTRILGIKISCHWNMTVAEENEAIRQWVRVTVVEQERLNKMLEAHRQAPHLGASYLAYGSQ